jgi:hypothetical protein
LSFDADAYIAERSSRSDPSLLRETCRRCNVDTFMVFERQGPHSLTLRCRECGRSYRMADWGMCPGRPVVAIPQEALDQYPSRSIRSIAIEFGINDTTLRNRLFALGFNTRLRRASSEAAARARAGRSARCEAMAVRIRALWEEGWSCREIEKEVGCTRSPITNALRNEPSWSEGEARRRGRERTHVR